MSVRKNKPNWLFRSLIGISIVIHAFIFMHVAGIYHSSALSFIELTMEDLSKPFSRDIPRPRLKPKDIKKPREMKKIELKKRVMPSFKPMKVDRIDNNISSGIAENIGTSDLLDGSGLDLAGWDPNAMAGLKEILTRKDYFELIQLRIESHKVYPNMAKMKRIEGRTSVQFIIALNGTISGLSIVTSSRNKSLDDAAIAAVEDSSPFPRPPLKLFSGPIPLEITIVFETT